MPKQQLSLQDILEAPAASPPRLLSLGDIIHAAPVAVSDSNTPSLPDKTARPNFDPRTAMQVAEEGVLNVARGIPQAVTGIPSAVAGIPSAVAGVVSALDQALTGGGTSKGVEIIKSMLSPVLPIFQSIMGDPPAPNDPVWAQAQEGAGATLGNLLLAKYAPRATKAIAKRLPSTVRIAMAHGPRGFIEQMIGPVGKERQALTAQLSPQLTRDAELLTARTQQQFDSINWSRLKAAEQALGAAENTIPEGTTLSKQALLADVKEAMTKFRVEGEPLQRQVPVVEPGRGVTGFRTESVLQYVSGHLDALKVLEQAYAEIQKFEDAIPFEKLRKYRQQLDQAIQTSNGWSETASAADRAAMQAKRIVVNAVRNDLRGISPALDAANAAYSRASDVVSASGLDWNTGRRLATVGKLTAAQRIVKRAAPYAIGAAAGTAGYKTYRVFESK